MPEQIEITEEHLQYLDSLQMVGVTNMIGAGEYLARRFKITRAEGNAILSHWIETYAERREAREKGFRDIANKID